MGDSDRGTSGEPVRDDTRTMAGHLAKTAEETPEQEHARAETEREKADEQPRPAEHAHREGDGADR